jgi:hypothetical protein
VNLDVDVYSPQAVSVQRSTSRQQHRGHPRAHARQRVDRLETAQPRRQKREGRLLRRMVAACTCPSAGVVEGIHQVAIRPAQGELGELIFDVPAGATITDVLTGRRPLSNCRQSTTSQSRRPAIARFPLAV